MLQWQPPCCAPSLSIEKTPKSLEGGIVVPKGKIKEDRAKIRLYHYIFPTSNITSIQGCLTL